MNCEIEQSGSVVVAHLACNQETRVRFPAAQNSFSQFHIYKLLVYRKEECVHTCKVLVLTRNPDPNPKPNPARTTLPVTYYLHTYIHTLATSKDVNIIREAAMNLGPQTCHLGAPHI